MNWNGAAFLSRLLTSLETHPVVVVDNSSTDASLSILSNHPRVKVIANIENAGYAIAANQGIAVCTTPYVLLLNVDLEVLPGSIEVLEQQMQREDVAIASPQLLFPDGRLQPSLRAFPSASSVALYLSYLDRIFPTNYRLPSSDHQQIHEVDQPMGAAMLIRKSVWESVGRFDQEYFLYMEEVDFCYRVKRSGYKIVYVPEAKMMHHAGGSSRQAWEKSQQHLLDSTFLYFRKHAPAEARKLRWMLPPALILRGIVLLFAGRFRQSWFYFRAIYRS